MILGVVNAEHESLVRLRVIGPHQTSLDIDALVDTGCTSSLVLPADIVEALDLIQQPPIFVILADGSRRITNAYAALIDWDGTIRGVAVSALGTQPVVGMGLLDGHELRVEAAVGGAVEIRPLVASAP